jgi:hypothetical protein
LFEPTKYFKVAENAIIEHFLRTSGVGETKILQNDLRRRKKPTADEHAAEETPAWPQEEEAKGQASLEELSLRT